jgi:hypothetical protein
MGLAYRYNCMAGRVTIGLGAVVLGAAGEFVPILGWATFILGASLLVAGLIPRTALRMLVFSVLTVIWPLAYVAQLCHFAILSLLYDRLCFDYSASFLEKMFSATGFILMVFFMLERIGVEYWMRFIESWNVSRLTRENCKLVVLEIWTLFVSPWSIGDKIREGRSFARKEGCGGDGTIYGFFTYYIDGLSIVIEEAMSWAEAFKNAYGIKDQ